MKNWKTLFLLFFVILSFWFIKFYVGFPNLGIDIISVILTVSSILFGFLAGFFISELWSRYTQIREVQGKRTSETLNMIKYASHFFNNKKFKNEFEKYVEQSAIVDEMVDWDQGNLEIPYFIKIEDSFKYIKVTNKKSEIYFGKLMEGYHELIESIVKIDVLYRERLFLSEWIMLLALSLIISLSVLFLDVNHVFYRIIIFTFPAIIVLALSTIYELDTMKWSREIITLEPNERVLEAINAKRFYSKKSLKYISNHVKEYRTEDDLKGELKKICNSISGLE